MNHSKESDVYQDLPDSNLGEVDKKRRLILACFALGVAGGGFFGACESNKKTDKPPLWLKTLFKKAKPIDVPREMIPDILPSLISEHGRIIDAPKNCNPYLPHIFIVGQHHVKTGNSSQRYSENLGMQAQSLAIFHALYSIGVKVAFNEGNEAGLEVTHTSPLTKKGITIPGTSIEQTAQSYLARGEIDQVTKAIEGIYKGDVLSMGIEPENFRQIISRLFTREMQIEKNDILRKVKTEFLKRVKQLRLSENMSKRALAKNILLNFDGYDLLLTHQAEQYDYIFNARSSYWTSFLNDQVSEDCISCMGAGHVRELKDCLDSHKMNVWTIAPVDLYYKYDGDPQKIFPKEPQSMPEWYEYWLKWDIDYLLWQKK